MMRLSSQLSSKIQSLDYKNVIYLGHIGQCKDKGTLYKYGISYKPHQRFKKHKQTFGTFDPIMVVEYDRNRQVEALFTKLMKHRNLLTTLHIDNKYYREIVAPSQFDHMDAFKSPETLLMMHMEALIMADSVTNNNLFFNIHTRFE